jgi:hypothetical protein
MADFALFTHDQTEEVHRLLADLADIQEASSTGSSVLEDSVMRGDDAMADQITDKTTSKTLCVYVLKGLIGPRHPWISDLAPTSRWTLPPTAFSSCAPEIGSGDLADRIDDAAFLPGSF